MSGGAGRDGGVDGGGQRPLSGLKNPGAAIRGVAAATLALEALVLLLALQPIRIVAPDTPGWGLGVVAGLAVCCVVVAGMMRRPWGWRAGLVLQVVIVLTGFLQWALFVLGAVFLAIWLYEMRLRRTLARPARFDH